MDEFASYADVTPKTVREWIREGMPTMDGRGQKGVGNGAVINVPMGMLWLGKKRQPERFRRSWAVFLNKQAPYLRNPMRWAVEEYHYRLMSIMAKAVEAWATDKQDGRCEWEKVGITEKQAREIAWSVGSLVLLLASTYKTEGFEKHLSQNGEHCNLDEMASIFLDGKIETSFKDEVSFPESLQQFAPPGFFERAERHARQRKGTHG